ncbi:MAG: hypothetical protein HWE21_10990 [Cytophagia bacterium]|nr:hypothetical protein [Cytophagia bacterium]
MKDDILKKIDEAILSASSEDGESILDSTLKDAGYDLNEIASISSKAYKRQAFLMRGKLNYEKDQNLLKQASAKLRQALDQNLDKPISYLRNLLSENELAVQYRNLDKLGVEEIKDIIKDQNLIEIMEMLDNGDQS